MIQRKHFARFYSPGTFMAEMTAREIGEWSTAEAMRIAATITERHGAKPYGFRFETHITAEPIPDGQGGTLTVESKPVETSGMHYIKGTVRRYTEVPDDDRHRIARGNMRANDHPLIVETANGWTWTAAFEANDCTVDADGKVLETGSDPHHVAYREEQIAAWKAGDE